MPLSDYLLSIFRKADPEPTPPAPVTLTDPLASWLFGAQPTYSNIAVTSKSAMQVPAVASAVTLISDAVGTLPVKLYVRNGKGKEADPAHPAFTLVHDEANDWTSAAELRTQLTRDALLHDRGGFAIANRLDDGRVQEFVRQDPLAVEPKVDELTGEPFYLVGKGQKRKRYEYWDVLHIQNGLDGAPISMARNAIALAIRLEQRASALASNGAPGVVITTDTKDGTVLRNIMDAWQAAFGDAGSTGRPAVLPTAVSVHQAAMTSVDAQFLEQRRYQVEEIARAFRVPPTMLFDLTRGTWSNTEEMRADFLENALRPWLLAWRNAYARVLLTADERRKFYFDFITDDLMTVNPTVRTEIYGKLVSMRAMTPNEVRAGLNMPALPGGDELANPYTTSAPPAQAANDNPPDTEKDAA